MKTKGQVLITFDDGTWDHYDACKILSKHGLCGTFGIVTSKTNELGFLSDSGLKDMQKMGAFICNHTHEHKWSGTGQPKPGMLPASKDEITEDILKAKKILNDKSYHGNYLLLPFGTSNVHDSNHMTELLEEITWVRATIGAPLPAEFGLWSPQYGKRLYPRNYAGRIIGLTEPADVRRLEGVKEKVSLAAEYGKLAVIMYHSICHVVGETQQVTTDRFMSDIKHIADLVNTDKLDCISPMELVES